jgi:hypothetical protein
VLYLTLGDGAGVLAGVLALFILPFERFALFLGSVLAGVFLARVPGFVGLAVPALARHGVHPLAGSVLLLALFFGLGNGLSVGLVLAARVLALLIGGVEPAHRVVPLFFGSVGAALRVVDLALVLFSRLRHRTILSIVEPDAPRGAILIPHAVFANCQVIEHQRKALDQCNGAVFHLAHS